uniref:Putative secreted protein n=1 Tax=Anopheles darlingi TaxID=43151 RepID=A0A2M4DE74_ANODA
MSMQIFALFLLPPVSAYLALKVNAVRNRPLSRHLCPRNERERVLFRQHQLVVLEANVTLDPSIVDKIRHDTVRLLDSNVLDTGKAQRRLERFHIDLMYTKQQVHLPAQVPIGQNLKLLHDQIDTGTDEEQFVACYRVIEPPYVPFADGGRQIVKLGNIVPLEHLLAGHVTQQHLHRGEVGQY